MEPLLSGLHAPVGEDESREEGEARGEQGGKKKENPSDGNANHQD